MARKPKTRAPYRMVSPQTWELARADYLGGMTAQAVADKHGIGLPNLRQTMARKGWTKRALADARAMAGPGGPPVTGPAGFPSPGEDARVSGPPAAEAPTVGDDLLEAVLARARAALTAGRGGEASALLKATREFVIVQQDVADARAALADGVKIWDTAQPARAGEATELLMVQSLHVLWSRLSAEERAERADPDGRAGLKAWMEAVEAGRKPRARKGRVAGKDE